MFYIITTLLLLAGAGFYVYKKRHNDKVTELLNCTYDDVKCIKYQYRGKKYLYLTTKQDEDIVTIEKEIDITNPEKDKIPETDYKYIVVNIKENESDHEIILDEPKLLYAFIGPANTYYFAFDKNFNDKLTKFMFYLFETEQGALTYGHLSALLDPNIYFNIKTKIQQFRKSENVMMTWQIK